MKDFKSAARRSQELEEFKKLLASYEPLGESQPPRNPDEAAVINDALGHYHAMGADLWKIALLVTEHLPQETRSRELAWMKERLQSAGMIGTDS